MTHRVRQPQFRHQIGDAWGTQRYGLGSHLDHVGPKSTGTDLSADTRPCFQDDDSATVAPQLVCGCQTCHPGTDDRHCFAHQLRVRKSL